MWFFTTLLMSRCGERSASENVCLFINMFLLYFLANGIQADWENAAFTFNAAWALILANLIAHWATKLLKYDNLDTDDCKIVRYNIVTLTVQLAVVITALFLPGEANVAASWIALIVGGAAWRQPRVYRAIAHAAREAREAQRGSGPDDADGVS